MAKRHFSARRPRTAVEAKHWAKRKLDTIESHARCRCEEMMGFFDEGQVSTVLEDMLTDIANSIAEVMDILREEADDEKGSPA